MSRIRVVVTGLGATTPLGGDAATTWEGLLAGKSGVARIAADWADDLPVKIAAQAAVDPAEILERVEARRLDRCAQLAVVAAMEAWQDAGYGLREDNPVDRERLGVAIATGIGGMMTLLSQVGRPEGEGVATSQPVGDTDADGQCLGSQRELAAWCPSWSTHAGVGLRVEQRVDLTWPGHAAAGTR